MLCCKIEDKTPTSCRMTRLCLTPYLKSQCSQHICYQINSNMIKVLQSAALGVGYGYYGEQQHDETGEDDADDVLL